MHGIETEGALFPTETLSDLRRSSHIERGLMLFRTTR